MVSTVVVVWVNWLEITMKLLAVSLTKTSGAFAGSSPPSITASDDEDESAKAPAR